MAGKISASVLQLFKNALNLNDDEEEVLIDLQVGKKVFHGVEKKMRSELWLSILHRKGIGIAAAKKYNFYLNQDIEMQTADDISKDVHRTFPKVQRFASEEGRRSLENVLRAYAAYDEEVGYCQGMNFLGGILLAWLSNEADAFGGLVVLMMDRGLREMYKHDMSMLQARLWQVGRLLPARLASHLEMHGVLPVLYASSWLLTGFASDFPLFFSSRVMDVILTDRYVEAMMKLVVGIVSECGEELLALDDMEEIVEVLKVTVPRWPRERLQALLTRSFAASWTPHQLRVLEQTEGAESVVDAVARVSRVSQDEGDRALPDEASASTPGEPERGPSFRWAGNMRASNRQLPLLPPVSLPARASSGNPAGGSATPPTPAAGTPSKGFNVHSPAATPSPPVRDLLDVRLSWPGDASISGDTPHGPAWDPFGPCDSQEPPPEPTNGLGDWRAFTYADPAPSTNPTGGYDALREHPSDAMSPVSVHGQVTRGMEPPTAVPGLRLPPGPSAGGGAGWGANTDAAHGDGGPARHSSASHVSSGTGDYFESPTDWTSASDVPLDSPFSSEPGRGDDARDAHVSRGEGPEGNAEVSARQASKMTGSGRRSGGLPPPHRSSSGKGGGSASGSGLTLRLTGGLPPNPGMMERRSESWGSFTEAGRASDLGGRASDLESWGSFRQPSDDGGFADERDGDAGPAGEEGMLTGFTGRAEEAGSDGSAQEGCPVGAMPGRDGRNAVMLRAASVGLPSGPGGKPEMTASVSTPTLATAGGPPRHDSALELDLLSRFMKESNDIPNP